MSQVDALQADLDALLSLDRAALVERWTTAFGSPSPRNCRVSLLQQALAWHLQVKQQGSRSLAKQSVRALRATSPASDLSPGTRLLREWQGQTHQVIVLSKGFEYQGATYRSLSAIARLITGTPWSGPLFFGLRS